jgi:hypothetical protein
MVSFIPVFDDRLKAEAGWNESSMPTVLGNNSSILGREDARNM